MMKLRTGLIIGSTLVTSVAMAASAATLADLRLYLRQHHAERDLVALGRAVVDAGESW